MIELESIPESVADDLRPDAPTVVAFLDFDCPHSRVVFPALVEVTERRGARLVLRWVPRTERALIPARVAICSEPSGHVAEVATALFDAATFDMEEAIALAVETGVPEPEIRACAPGLDALERMREDTGRSLDAEVEGLPAVFVGREHWTGEVSVSDLEASLERWRPDR